MATSEPLNSVSPAVYQNPERHVATGEPFASLDLREWSEEYEWERDPVAGPVDYLTDPRTTVAEKRGDCEDYAFVVASTLLERGVSPVEI